MTDLFRLNESNFEELFFDTSRLQNVFEKEPNSFRYDLPNPNLGSYTFTTEKRGQLYLTNYKSYFYKNILSTGDSIENIAIYFMKKGKGYDFTHKKDCLYKANTHNVLFMNKEVKMEGIYLKNVQQVATSLHFSKDYFKVLTERYPELLASSFLRYEKGESFYLNDSYLDTTPQMYQILWQLENSHLMGNNSSAYADAKALELFSMLFTTENHKAYKSYEHCKTKSDYDKIQEASFILMSDIHNPPTIRSLSLQVGINEKKLKYGFKEVFGTTIYGYLFEYKMSLAKQLLQDTDKSIWEIAELCGYEYTSHFCTAFKRRFGVSPGSSRK